MAPSSPYRQAVGQYGANSIAGRGPVQIPSSKRRGSAASDGGGYMQAATMGGQTRADKIAASRADGTFDAKRNAYNGANKGSFMDASGNIGPKAEMPTAPIAATTPATSAPTAQPATPAAMGPPKPRGAMFDGKPKAEFFADAARRGVASMPSGVYDQPGIAAKIKSPMATPSMAAAAADTRGTKQAVAIQGAAKSIADANKIIAENKATRKPMPPMSQNMTRDKAVTRDKAGVETRERYNQDTAAATAQMRKNGMRVTGAPGSQTFSLLEDDLKAAEKLNSKPDNPAAAPAPAKTFVTAAPANQPRAIDAYVSSPGNRSVMTGKTSEQQAAEAAKAKKAAAAQKTFRAPYLPNRARTMGIN